MRELETTVSYLKFHLNQRKLFENRNKGAGGDKKEGEKKERILY